MSREQKEKLTLNEFKKLLGIDETEETLKYMESLTIEDLKEMEEARMNNNTDWVSLDVKEYSRVITFRNGEKKRILNICAIRERCSEIALRCGASGEGMFIYNTADALYTEIIYINDGIN